jgi:O-succinylbenzoic acid--CoA ligase
VQVLTADDGQAPLDRLRGGVEQALSSGPGLAVLPAGPPAWRETLTRAVQPAREVADGLVVPTSGSTGSPVGVVLSADAVRWSAQSVNDRLGGPGSWLLALPLTHVAGLMVLARAVVADRAVVAVTRGWADAVERLPAGARYTAVVPTQLRRLLQTEPTVLAGLDAVVVGGASLSPSLRERAERAGARVIDSYGMTETCGGCVHDGRPLPGVDVQIGPEGRVLLAGPMLATAYRRPGADEPVAPDGWFATSDVGEWHVDRLRVTGRLDDVVTTGGVSVSLAAVDELLAQYPGFADVAAVGVPDDEWGARVVAVAVPAPGEAPTLESVRGFVAGRAEPAYVPRQLVLVNDLERPAPGKINRARVGRLVEGR